MTDDWIDHLRPSDEDDLRIKSERLARVLRHLPGDDEFKTRFLMQNIPLFEAEADKSGLFNGKRRSGAIVSMAIRYYRQAWNSRGREKPQMTGRRSSEPTKLRSVFGND